jgi:hypothetical protein
MNTLLINVLIYCIPTIGAIFVTVTIISKTVLKKNGFKVTFLWMDLSDIKKMNKLSMKKADIRVLYHSLLISTIGFLSLFLLAFIVIITEIISRS